ncbi:MAG: hypothetical protein KAH22_09845 [Thiotrichaceae bacterium]|nr:hypothetical protein [Thiotrichaceae bacterium]
MNRAISFISSNTNGPINFRSSSTNGTGNFRLGNHSFFNNTNGTRSFSGNSSQSSSPMLSLLINLIQQLSGNRGQQVGGNSHQHIGNRGHQHVGSRGHHVGGHGQHVGGGHHTGGHGHYVGGHGHHTGGHGVVQRFNYQPNTGAGFKNMATIPNSEAFIQQIKDEGFQYKRTGNYGSGSYDLYNNPRKPKGERNIYVDKKNHKISVGSPIALDLNNDGKIGTTGDSTAQERAAGSKLGSTVKFDLNADGKQESTEWLAGDGDGLLVDTTKIGANNAINGQALFGDMGGQFNNGYDKLALHDTNNDSKISGSELDNLKVWVDDGDAKLEAGELHSLSEYGINQLSTQAQNVLNGKGEALIQSTATTNDGQSVLTEDVWFGTNK